MNAVSQETITPFVLGCLQGKLASTADIITSQDNIILTTARQHTQSMVSLINEQSISFTASQSELRVIPSLPSGKINETSSGGSFETKTACQSETSLAIEISSDCVEDSLAPEERITPNFQSGLSSSPWYSSTDSGIVGSTAGDYWEVTVTADQHSLSAPILETLILPQLAHSR